MGLVGLLTWYGLRHCLGCILLTDLWVGFGWILCIVFGWMFELGCICGLRGLGFAFGLGFEFGCLVCYLVLGFGCFVIG